MPYGRGPVRSMFHQVFAVGPAFDVRSQPDADDRVVRSAGRS